MSETYRNRETHAITLASGQPLAPGEADALTVDDEGRIDPHDQNLIDAGALVLVDETTDYNGETVEALTNLAASRNVTAKGTGKDGSVVKADLVRALQAADQKGN